MADYGNTIEPGIVTNVNSALTVTASGRAPADVGIVGQADLSVGTASPNEVYQVTRASDARVWFGDESPLMKNIEGALVEGAYPVYAVATELVDVEGEDLSGLSSSEGAISEGPASEVAEDATFTIGGTELTTVITYEDVSTVSPGAGEVYLNPSSGEFNIDPGLSIGATGDSVDYKTADYLAALEALGEDAGGAVDFVVPLSENIEATGEAQNLVSDLANEYNLAMAVVGAIPGLDVLDYSNSFDDSRVQVIYPARNEDGDSVLGSYAGLRAKLGINGTPINKRLGTQRDLYIGLTRAERGSLIEERVVPLADESEGARICDDVNTVSDDNSQEANIRFGFSRLVMDYIIGTIRVNERPFIGRLNNPAVRAALEGLLNNQLKTLKRSNAILDYDVRVTPLDATSAAVEIQVETAKPLRFIKNAVTVGDSA